MQLGKIKNETVVASGYQSNDLAFTAIPPNREIHKTNEMLHVGLCVGEEKKEKSAQTEGSPLLVSSLHFSIPSDSQFMYVCKLDVKVLTRCGFSQDKYSRRFRFSKTVTSPHEWSCQPQKLVIKNTLLFSFVIGNVGSLDGHGVNGGRDRAKNKNRKQKKHSRA
jgi:hypothetical protein